MVTRDNEEHRRERRGEEEERSILKSLYFCGGISFLGLHDKEVGSWNRMR